jgi:hypothetical protein
MPMINIKNYCNQIFIMILYIKQLNIWLYKYFIVKILNFQIKYIDIINFMMNVIIMIIIYSNQLKNYKYILNKLIKLNKKNH